MLLRLDREHSQGQGPIEGSTKTELPFSSPAISQESEQLPLLLPGAGKEALLAHFTEETTKDGAGQSYLCSVQQGQGRIPTSAIWGCV